MCAYTYMLFKLAGSYRDKNRDTKKENGRGLYSSLDEIIEIRVGICYITYLH